MGGGSRALGLGLCMALALVGTMALRIQFPAVSFYARSALGSSALDIGLLTSSFMAARATASILVGRLYRRVEVARVLPPACFALNAGIAYLYLYASSVWVIMGLRAVQGFLNGLAWVTVQVALGELSPASARATMYTAYFSIGSLGIACANYLYSYIAKAFPNPYDASMHVSTALFLVAAAIATPIPYPPIASRGRGVERKAVARVLALLALLMASISVAMALPSSDVVYIYVGESMSMSRSEVATLIASALIVATGVGLALSIVADRLSEGKALATISGIAVASCVAIAIPSPIAFAAAMTMLVSLARSARSIARRVAISRAGAMGVGIVNAAGNVGNVLGSAIVGALYDALGHSYVELGALKLNEALATLYVPTSAAIAASAACLARGGPRKRSS